MALTTSDLHTNLAYRLGESSAPSDSTVKAQRLEWMNVAYFNIATRRKWWWLQAVDTTNTNTGATSYSEPTDLSEFIELKIGTQFYDEIPYYRNQEFQNALGVVTLPTLRSDYKYYRLAGSYYLIPTDGNDGTTHTITYYKRPVKITDGGSFLIPDNYTESLTAYAEARYWMSITQQLKAQAPFQEFEQIITMMEREDTRHRWQGGVLDPDEAQIYG